MLKKVLYIIIPFLIVLSCAQNDTSVSDTNKISKPQMSLLTAVAKADFEMINQHIDYGTDINSKFVTDKDWKGASSLHIAAISPTNSEQLKIFTKVVGLLLEGGANIEIKARNADEATPLAWAVYFGKYEMAQLLVKKGANVNSSDKNGYTPLDGALSSPFMGSELNRSAIVNFLKEKGAKTKDGK